MAKKISRTTKTLVATLASSTSNGVRGRYELINVPQILMGNAEAQLRQLVPNLPTPLVYPLPNSVIIPPSAEAEASKLLIQYFSMAEYSNRIKPRTNCENPCIVGGKVDCCDAPPNLMAAPSNANTDIDGRAFCVPTNFDLLFFDEDNLELDAAVRVTLNRSDLKYYRVVDDEFLFRIDVVAAENYTFEL